MDCGCSSSRRGGGQPDRRLPRDRPDRRRREAWGLDIVWLAEMMVNPTRSVLSAPLLVSSWAAARTKRLRVGTAVQLLPLNHPLRVAGEITTLDHLSQGRFDFGIGRSGSPRSYDALGVPYDESQARFFEALEIILQAWKGEAFSYQGQFYRFTDVTVTPRRTAFRTRWCAWPRRPRRRFPASGRWGCRSSWACAAWTSRAGGLPDDVPPGLA